MNLASCQTLMIERFSFTKTSIVGVCRGPKIACLYQPHLNHSETNVNMIIFLQLEIEA